MRKIVLLTTSLAGLSGMTVQADSLGPELPANGFVVPAEALVIEVPAAAEAAPDPFSVALAVLDGGADTGVSSDSLPPLVDCFRPGECSAVPSALLANGKVSSFRVGEGESVPSIVSEDGGLWVGATAVDRHVIEIAAEDGIKAGTYTLIDYEGAIGGAGFDGLVLRGVPPTLHVELLNNTAETKIELVVSEADGLKWPEAAGGLLNPDNSTLWMPFGEVSAFLPGAATVSGDIGILQLLGLPVLPPARDALQ